MQCDTDDAIVLSLILSEGGMVPAAFGRRDFHAAYAAYTQLLNNSADSHAEALTNRSLIACKLGTSLRCILDLSGPETMWCAEPQDAMRRRVWDSTH